MVPSTRGDLGSMGEPERPCEGWWLQVPVRSHPRPLWECCSCLSRGHPRSRSLAGAGARPRWSSSMHPRSPTPPDRRAPPPLQRLPGKPAPNAPPSRSPFDSCARWAGKGVTDQHAGINPNKHSRPAAPSPLLAENYQAFAKNLDANSTQTRQTSKNPQNRRRNKYPRLPYTTHGARANGFAASASCRLSFAGQNARLSERARGATALIGSAPGSQGRHVGRRPTF